MQSSKNRNISIFQLFFRPFIALTILLSIGTFAYTHLEGWNPLDSLFMSVGTLTTVGYGMRAKLSTAGEIFTIIYMFFGVILFLYIAAEFAEYVLYVNFEKILSKKTMESKLKKLKNHYIVCGYGRTGAEIIYQLKNNKLEYVVIDKNAEFEDIAQNEGLIYVLGDATDDITLEKAGIDRAKGIFCALSDDVDNLYLTVSSRNLNPELAIVTRCIKASNEQKFKKAGATSIILPYEISGRRMVASVVKPLVVDFLDDVIHTNGKKIELKMEQYKIKNGSILENQTIISSELRQKTGIIIIAIERNGDFMTNPSPDTVLEAEDHLITLGTSVQQLNFEKLVS